MTASCSGRFTYKETIPGTLWIGGWETLELGWTGFWRRKIVVTVRRRNPVVQPGFTYMKAFGLYVIREDYRVITFTNKIASVRKKRNLVSLDKNCCSGKAISTTYCKSVSVALFTQHVKRMLRIALAAVTCLAAPYFCLSLLHKLHCFRKKSFERTMYVWVLMACFFKTFLIIRRIHRDTIVSALCLHVKCPLFLSDFNET